VTDKSTRKKQKNDSTLKKLPGTTEKDIFCIFCDDLFEDPPFDDWIECSNCRRWCHEKCADTDLVDTENNFVCGEC